MDLERAKANRSLTALTVKEKELDEESKNLVKTVEQQTTGLTSLGEVLDQLASSGATTTQVLEIFGVRGGTAIASLLTQRESFHALVKENENATDATAQFTRSIQGQDDALGSAKESFFLFVSAVQESMLTIGKPFVDMLMEISAAFKDEIADAIKENLPLFKDLAIQIGLALKQIIPMALDALPAFINALKFVIPIVTILAQAFIILMQILSPVLQLLAGIMQVLQGIASVIMAIVSGRIGDIPDAIASVGQGLKDAALGALGTAMMGLGGGLGGLFGVVGGGLGVIGGSLGFGKIGSGITGGLMDMVGLSNGGIVTSPTPALIGEAGAEAVVPLGADKATERVQIMHSAGLGGGISIGNIVINGDARLTAGEVRAMLMSELPKALNRSVSRGSRGVI